MLNLVVNNREVGKFTSVMLVAAARCHTKSLKQLSYIIKHLNAAVTATAVNITDRYLIVQQ